MSITNNFSIFAKSRVHLGVCGSIAAYKAVDLMRRLQKMNILVSVTLTESAKRFIQPLTFEALGASPVYGTLFCGDEAFSHLEPATYAHSFCIVPASANTMARIAHGMADDMLASQALAFKDSLLIAPAMNPGMWANPSTQNNVSLLRSFGHSIITPGCGVVACGVEGQGKLPEVSELVLHVVYDLARAKSLQDMRGKKVLVTLGPTREPWDAVRYWTNRSTGIMGASLVYAAWLRGAEVYAITGPGVPDLPPGVTVIPCESAKDMYEAAVPLWQSMDYGIFSAAVADYSPEPYRDGKFKKSTDGAGLSISFTDNVDILKTLGLQKTKQKIMGFAAESHDMEANALRKLNAKNADMLVGNWINREGSGFGTATNAAYVCFRDGSAKNFPQMSKEDLAWNLLDCLCAL